MREIAPDVHLITGFPPYAVNCFVIGDVLIDAMGKHDSKRILKALRGRTIDAHALTHAHPDHQGSSHAVCEALGIPLWVHEADADAVEDPSLIRARQPVAPAQQRDGQDLHRARPPRRSHASPRATTSPGSRSSTRRGTRPVTSASGASPTGSSSPATC